MRTRHLALLVAVISAFALINGFMPEYAMACLIVSAVIALVVSVP